MRWKSIWLSLVFALWWEGCLSLKGSDLILQAKAKAAEEKLNPTTEEVIVGEDGNSTTVVKKPLLTGIPQKDYIHDPNLPRELKGHNLTNYPFYNAVPEEIEFACDGLHDGFYASVPHHCQVYHHCLFGTRYDFLCANYTAFDQKTFICHFVSEVDCENSPKYYIRNEALYKAASTAPPPTTTTATTTTTKPTTTTRKPRRRRPQRRRRPYYEYYYDSEEYDEEYYDDEEDDPLPPPRKSGRKQRPSQGSSKKEAETTTTTTTAAPPSPSAGAEPPLTRAPASVYSRNRIPPKIRPPVPVNERHKYEYKTTAGPQTNKDLDEDEEYYDDEYDEQPPPPPKKKDTGREKMNRRRPQGGRKRPSRYEDDEYEEEEEERPRRKGNRKDDDYRRNRNRKGGYRDEEEDRPMRGGNRKRYQEETRRERRPAAEYEYYDDDEEEDKYEKPRTRKPDKRTRTTTKKYEKTTEAPDEEYEEYEDEEEDLKANKKDVTTSAPQRASTTPFKSSKPATSRSSVYRRAKPSLESERRYKPISKRVESSTEETSTYRRPIVMKPTVFPDRKFTSIVGTPTGFRRQEEKNHSEPTTEATKEEEKPEVSRKSPDVYRKYSNFRRQQEDDRKDLITSKNPVVVKDDKTIPSKAQESSTSKSEEAMGYKMPIRSEENTGNYRNIPSRHQDFTSRYEDMTSTARVPQKEQQPQNSRRQPNRGYESHFVRSEENNTPTRNSYKDETEQPVRTFPSRTRESYDESKNDENTSNAFRTPNRNEEQYFRNPTTRQQEERIETPISSFRSPYRQEETSNYRNPTASSDEMQYRSPPFRDEDTIVNYRSQAASVANTNYRNPHTSADQSEDDQEYKISSFIPNDGYQRQEVRWPPKEDSFMPIQPTAQPPIEGKPYITGPGSDQTQEGSSKTGYPPAITSPPRGYRRYNKMKVSVRPKPVTEENVEFNKYPLPEEVPKVEFTAPGPSAPQATPRPYLDLEEYDVTLNDALQPSTPYSRHKTRVYQSSVTNPSYRTGYLLTAASQTYPTKIASEYEAVVVPSQRFSSKRRPHEWYW